MSSNFTIFSSAISALNVNSLGLSIAGQNIANVNTPGYSRQRINIAPAEAQTSGTLEVGRGALVKDVQRIYDNFAEARLADASSENGQADARAEQLNQVQELFNEIGQDGISKFMSDFFNSFNGVAADPTATAPRLDALSKAGTLVQRLHSLSQALKDNRTSIDTAISSRIDKINSIAAEITDINDKINLSGGETLVLRDQRALKVRELSEMMDVKSVETSNGEFQVYFGNGLQLLSGVSRATLSTEANTNDLGHFKVMLTVGSGSAVDVSDRVTGGSLKGYLTARDTDIPAYEAKLNEVAYELATQVNLLHTSGYDLGGVTARKFFATLTSVAASTDLATNLRTSTGTKLQIASGDVITIGGNLGGAFSTTLTVSATTTLADIATAVQTALRAAAGASGTETAAVQGDGTIRVTSGATAITGLTLSIPSKTTFNTAFTFTTPITAGGGTGSSAALGVAGSDSAGLIAISSDVDGLPQQIAAASSAATLPAGNSIALQLVAIKDSSINFSTGSTTIGTFYSNLLSRVGTDAGQAARDQSFSSSVLSQSEQQRERISGVSIEEEQLDLARFQAAFQAASKLVAVAAEILKLLVEL